MFNLIGILQRVSWLWDLETSDKRFVIRCVKGVTQPELAKSWKRQHWKSGHRLIWEPVVEFLRSLGMLSSCEDYFRHNHRTANDCSVT